jgi:sugar phosphate isomerase/epimerase
MELACSALAFCKRPLEVALDGVAGLGFQCVDLAVLEGWAHVHPSELVRKVEAKSPSLRELLERRGLRCVAMNCGLGARERPERLRRFLAVARLAKTLGAGVITLPGGAGSVHSAAEAFQPLVRLAANEGVRVTAETHIGNTTERPAAAAALCEAVPGLMLTLDPSHYAAGPARGEDIGPVLPYVRHVHIRDAGTSGEALQVPYGTGSVDVEQILTRLAESGYDGAVSIEYIEGFGPDAVEESVATAADHIRGILSQING